MERSILSSFAGGSWATMIGGGFMIDGMYVIGIGFAVGAFLIGKGLYLLVDR